MNLIYVFFQVQKKVHISTVAVCLCSFQLSVKVGCHQSCLLHEMDRLWRRKWNTDLIPIVETKKMKIILQNINGVEYDLRVLRKTTYHRPAVINASICKMFGHTFALHGTNFSSFNCLSLSLPLVF